MAFSGGVCRLLRLVFWIWFGGCVICVVGDLFVDLLLCCGDCFGGFVCGFVCDGICYG